MSYQGYYPPHNPYQQTTTTYTTVNSPQTWWGYFINQINPQQLGVIRVRQIKENFRNGCNNYLILLNDKSR